MTYTEVTEILAKNTTKKGNYKKQAVLDLVKALTTTRTCPKCEGLGVIRYSAEFAGPGCDITCHTCNGIGKI